MLLQPPAAPERETVLPTEADRTTGGPEDAPEALRGANLSAETAEEASARLGFEIAAIPAFYLQYYDFPAALWISRIDAQTAELTGLCSCDVLLEADGIPLQSCRDLEQALAAHAPGESVELLIYRAGETLRLTVELVS